MSSLMVVACGCAAARADVVAVALGAVPPPTLLDQRALEAAPDDRTPLFTTVNRVPLAVGMDAGISEPLTHRAVSAGWAEWGYGYDGDVYTTDGASRITITPASGVSALVFYVHADPFSRLAISASGDGGLSATQFATPGGGPVGFAFYADPGTTISSISVVSTGEFAIGQFLTAVPSPGPMMLGALTLGHGAKRSGRRRGGAQA